MVKSKSMLQAIHSDKAPKAAGPYSHAIFTNGFIFCSGQIGNDPESGILVDGIEAQTRQAIKNLQAVLQAANADLSHVVKTTVFLKHMTDFPLVNSIYAELFDDSKPARATIEVSNLPKGALFEIEAIAVAK